VSAVDVLAVGEALVDLISLEPVDALEDATRFERHLGGEPANVVHNVARLGGRAALVARVGDDGFGRFVRAELAAAGVDVRGVRLHPGAPTTVCAVARHAGTPDFAVLRGADRLLDASDVELAAGLRARAVHTSAFALSHASARRPLLELLRARRADGALVSFDPNYHPSVWADGEPLQVLAETLPHVDVVKPSTEDCHRLFGLEPVEVSARRFLDLGARRVVLTLGAEGALVLADGASTLHASRATAVVDVTGAGDAFWAGLLMGLVDGQELDTAVGAGLAVAALKLGGAGPLGETVDRRQLYGPAPAAARGG
jgi:sugar/nucleoside kinase (ribokinase family)